MKIFISNGNCTVIAKKYLPLLLFFFFYHFQAIQAQLVAFPGAEGAGRFATGGRGTPSTPTTVYEVTNLNDDNNPGSLRYAVTQNVANRTIVFRVSGTIHLNSKLNIRANTTVAGQTAPGDGICIADYPTVISGDNVIVRYMRFRMGDKNQLLTSPAGCGLPVAPFTVACTPVDGSGGDDAFGNLGNKNIIIDHCTVSWSSDEALTIYRGDSVTVQWNIVSEPLNYSYHFETGDMDFESHGYGGIWGSRHGSFHHNLIADAKGRSPRFSGSSTYPPGTVGQENVDFRNNVIYNWGSYSSNGGEGGNYNMINNYYKYGPSTSSGNSISIPIKGMIVQPSTAAPALPYGKFYLEGNYVDGYSAITANNWLGVSMASGTQADTTQAKVTTAFISEPVTTHTAQEAYDLVLQQAGASFARDTLDQRIINDVRNRTGKLIDVQGGYPHGTPYAATVNAWPILNTISAPVDTDHDGMPDSYETANGLNSNDPADRSGIAANNYTHLENYLNSITSSPLITINGTLNSFTQNINQPSAIQQYLVSAKNLTNGITITPPLSYEISADGGATWHTNASPIILVQSGGVVAATVISVRLNAQAPGTFSGNIIHVSSTAITQTIAVTGSNSPLSVITATGTLSAFFQTVGVPSVSQTYTVTGTNLTGNITIIPPVDYEISSNGGTTWSTTPLTLTQTGGTIAVTTINVRLNANSIGTHTGVLMHTSSGAVTKNLSVSGSTVVKPVIVVNQSFSTFAQTIGSSLVVQSYTVAGNNLTDNIIITPPVHYQLSTNNGTSWQSTPVTLTKTGTSVSSTMLWIRLNVPVTGMYAGILSHTSSDADAVNIPLSGYNKVEAEYSIYPVPASQTIFIAHPLTNEQATLTFYTINGQRIATYNTLPNTIETTINIAQLPQGFYYVAYQLADNKVILKFIKK